MIAVLEHDVDSVAAVATRGVHVGAGSLEPVG